MKHHIPHTLSRPVARRAVRAAMESYQAELSQYAPTGDWITDDRATVQFTAAGRTFKGAVDVTEHSVDLTLAVPLLFRPFRSVALGIIEREIQRWLVKAQAGAFDNA